MDTVLRVPAANIAAMTVTFLIAAGMPIVLFIIIRRRLKAKVSSFFVGCGAFILFAMVLEQLLHMVVLQGLGGVSYLITNNVWFYSLYGGLAAGIFEETGRFIAMKYMMRNSLSRENALMYGAGHGGVEAIMLVGFTYLMNLLYSVMLNSGSLDMMLAEESGAQLRTALEPLGTVGAGIFYIAGMERIMAIVLQIALSVLVYRAVSQKRCIGYYGLAIGIHFFVDFSVVVVSSLSGNMILAEAVCFVEVALTVLLALKVYQKSAK